MPAYARIPEGEGPWPAVLVISDALGMTADFRSQVDWLAAAGHVVIAPDLYYWGGGRRCLFTAVRQAMSGKGTVYRDFETARSWLLDHPACDGRVGVVGFCLGGGFALTLAGRGGFPAVAGDYGGLTKRALIGLARECPIVGSRRDRHPDLRKVPGQIASVLREHSIPFDIKLYPDAGHSFMNDHAASQVTKWSVVMGRFVASGYDEPSDHDARDRIVAFFDEHLAGSSARS